MPPARANANELRRHTDQVGDAFRADFGADRVTELTDPLPVSEDFGLFGQQWKAPSLFWYVGGTDPGVYHRAAQAGRIGQDVPTNHSSKFAPVLHPTLETGIRTLATASVSYLGHQWTGPGDPPQPCAGGGGGSGHGLDHAPPRRR